MGKHEIIRLNQRPELKDVAAAWFSSKWGVSVEAYQESMSDSLRENVVIPSWYLCLEGDKIIGGLGVIQNDFHDRKDLAPNICAVFTEVEYRGQGIAGKLLNFACEDMKSKGVSTLYLKTDHTDFYERYGWEFLCMAQGDGESEMTRIYIHR